MTTQRTTALAPYSIPTLGEFKEAKEKMGAAPELLKLEPRAQKYVARLVPGWQKRPALVTVSTHFCDFGNNKYLSANCPTEMRVPGQRCYMHEALERLAKSRNPIDAQKVKDWGARGAMYVNMLLRGETDKPQPWRGGWTFVKWLQGKLADFESDSRNGNPFDPGNGGFDFTIFVEKKAGNISYTFDVPRSSYGVPLHEDATKAEEWIKGACDLSQYAKIRPYDEVKQAYEEAMGMDRPTHNAPNYGTPRQEPEFVPSETIDDNTDL